MKSAARLAAYRSYRDRISKDFMTRIGLDTGADSVHPDLAFALPEPAQARPASGERDRLTVGVGVMSYNGWRCDKARDEGVYLGYLQKLTRFVSWLLDSGYRVCLLIGDETDQKAIDELMRLIEAARGPLDPSDIATEPAHSLHGVMEAIAKTDVVVATRFHNVVCALKLGRPVLSVGYAEKNNALLAAMGLEGFGQHVEEFEVELLIDQFRCLVASRRTLEGRIAAANAAFGESLLRQEVRIVEGFL
jgi:polysaccharide pyruvyl transferase WcaK-like protein